MRSVALFVILIWITAGGETTTGLRPSTDSDAADASERLRALGYVDSAPTPNPQQRGVTRNAPGAFAGFNLYSSRHDGNAHLIAMNGRVVHTWSDPNKAPWMHVELQPNGDLFAIVKDRYLIKVDWSSRTLWRRKTRAHHDLAVAPDGGILLLSREAKRYEIRGKVLPVLADRIEELSPAGALRREVELFPLLRDLIPKGRIRSIEKAVARDLPVDEIARPECAGDVFHTNSIEVMARDIQGIAPAGSILLSVRQLNRILILDDAMTQVLWEWGAAQLQGQHHASLLDNGNILVFDNGVRRRQSRVLEVDPRTGAIVWFHTRPGFYTRLRGAAQRLPNGNVLATESDRGHVFEVTPAGATVWEFWNPTVTSGKDPKRDAIYRMRRLAPAALHRNLAPPR